MLGLDDGPEKVVEVILKSWTYPLDAGPGPARIELQLGTGDQDTDMYADLTPAEARAVAAPLLELAATAEGVSTRGTPRSGRSGL